MASSFFDYKSGSDYKFPDYSSKIGNVKLDPSVGFGTPGAIGGDGFPRGTSKGGGTNFRDLAKLGAGFLHLQNFLDKDDDKYRSEFSRMPFSMGGVDGRAFGGSRLLENLSVYTPSPSHPPTFIQSPGESGGPSGGQRFARAGAGALQGFLSGAATGMPHMAGIGAVVGGLSSGFG